MNLKHCIYSLFTSLILVLSSCLGDSDDEEIIYSKDAQLLSFQLTHDSIRSLSTVLYTIDQQKGWIYNVDSMAFGSDIPEKVIFNFTTAGYSLCLLTEAEEDSTFLATGDSISIQQFVNQTSKYLRVYAYDGTKKEYSLNLRVHTVDPDSMIYTRLGELPTDIEDKVLYLNDRFYCITSSQVLQSSSDALNWTALSTNYPTNIDPSSLNVFKDRLVVLTTDGKLFFSDSSLSTWTELPLGSTVESIVSILGEIKGIEDNFEASLALIALSGGNRVFAKTDMESLSKGNEVPSTFPASDFASLPWTKRYNSTLLLFGGLSEASTPCLLVWHNNGDGITWTSSEPKGYLNEDFFIPYQSPNLFHYNNCIYLMNGYGRVEGGDGYNDRIYTSVDGGLTWKEMPSKQSPLPAGYTWRKDASVCVDANNYIYVLGGQNESAKLPDIWKGRLNHFGFK